MDKSEPYSNLNFQLDKRGKFNSKRTKRTTQTEVSALFKRDERYSKKSKGTLQKRETETAKA